MKRYDLIEEKEPEESSDGEWVRFEDIEHIIKQHELLEYRHSRIHLQLEYAKTALHNASVFLKEMGVR